MAKPRPVGITGHSTADIFHYYGYIWRHKWHVFLTCLRLKVPFIQALLHDNSKFSYAEFSPYLDWFYNDQGTKFNGGYTWEFTENENLRKAFDVAWNNHIHHNPHHWQYWLIEDKAIPMPEIYVREMVADWVGFSICKSGHNDVSTWYPKQKLNLHPKTRGIVEAILATNYGFSLTPKYADNNNDVWTVSNQCVNPGWWVIVNGCVCTEQEAPANTRDDAIALLVAHADKEGFKMI